ncbi:MAG: selenocysteine-specific translation elongation factor, partial [Chloroflexota bacterium]
MYVIGTAGHVDHGKSTLVHALTGINPDRLVEEQKRGMTIELGFAWLTLPSGAEVSLVDVPGHERFIKHMLAGVGGFDAAMLVIAADESVMPQTREHLAILDLLEISHGLVVITKADMVEAEWLPLVVEDVRRQLADSRLAQAPIVLVSARTGQGMDALRVALTQLVSQLPPPQRRDEPARLWVDRVFSVDGFGAVVTGTLLADTLKIGDEVCVLPRGISARIRGVQMHRQRLEVAQPGTRVALNLSGISHNDLRRGDLVVLPHRMTTTQRIDVRLRTTSIAPRPITQGMQLDVFVGSAESSCRVTVLDGDEIAPGASGLVQLHLTTPLPLWRGDRLIVRQASPSMTLGGGRVIDTQPLRHRRNRPEVIAALTALERATPADLCWAVIRGKLVHITEVMQQTHLAPAVVAQTVADLVPACQLGEWVVDRDVLQRMYDKTDKAIHAYAVRYPLRVGMPREELRRRLDVSMPAFEVLLNEWRAHIEHIGDGLVRRVGYHVTLTPAQQHTVQAVVSQ